MSVKNKTFLANVFYVTFSQEKQYRHGGVLPLLESDGEKWTRPIARLVETFPTRGRIFWHDAPERLKKESYWCITVAPHPSFKGKQDTDKFQVNEFKPAVEILDLRGSGMEGSLRGLLSGPGLAFDLRPLTNEVLLWVRDDWALGPVRLKHGGGRTWKLAEEDLNRLAAWTPPATGYASADIEGRTRFFLPPSGKPGASAGVTNWESDLSLASSVLRRLRKLDPARADKLELTYRVFDEYLATLESSGLVGPRLDQELARVDRIKALRETIEANDELLSLAVDACLNVDGVHDEVERHRTTLLEELRPKVAASLEAQFGEKHAELDRLDRSLEDKRAKLEAVRQELEREVSRLEQHVESFRLRLAERLRKAASEPNETLAELVLIQRVLGGMPNDGGKSSRPTSTRRSPAYVPSQQRPGNRLTDAALVNPALMKAFTAHGVPIALGRVVHSAFLSGGMPVITGGRGLAALKAYGSAMVGGRITWITVTAELLGPQDLLGRVDPTSRRFLPHASGLLRLLDSAENSDDVHLVVLEGLNRAAVDSYLFPLLQTMKECRQPVRPMAVPLMAAGTLDEEDPFAAVTTVRWQSNVLLAGVPTRGPASIGVSSELWRYAMLIDADEFDSDTPHHFVHPEAALEGAEETSVVSRAAWDALCKDARGVDLSELGRLISAAREDIPNALSDVDMALRLYAAACSCGMKHVEASELVAKACVAPLLRDDRSATSTARAFGLNGDAFQGSVQRANELSEWGGS